MTVEVSRRLERPDSDPPRPRDIVRDLGRNELVNGTIGALFAMSGPVAVILAVGANADLAPRIMASWIFGIFVLNGVLTILLSWRFRQPLGCFWTIPGSVIVGQSLARLDWSEVLGAYVLTGILITLIGLSGKVESVMAALPNSVVMAMVAGTFLVFGLDLIRAVGADPLVAVPMVAVFVLASSWGRLGRMLPPVLGALLVGIAVILIFGQGSAPETGAGWLAQPMLQVPEFTWRAIAELVIPLTITVVVVQNGQGRAVLRAAGHAPPMNLITVACGVWSLLAAAVGAISTCLTGPTNALLTASGERRRQYAAAIWCGLLAIGFGVLAPGVIALLDAAPAAFIATLGGLAMLRALGGAFADAFSGVAAHGALVSLLVTLSDVRLLGIGSAFWGLLAGVVIAVLMDGYRSGDVGRDPSGH